MSEPNKRPQSEMCDSLVPDRAFYGTYRWRWRGSPCLSLIRSLRRANGDLASFVDLATMSCVVRQRADKQIEVK